MNRSLRIDVAIRWCMVLALFATLATAQEPAQENAASGAIAISEVIPFSTDTTNAHNPLSSAFMQERASTECNMGQTLSELIVASAGKSGIEVVPTPGIESATGKVLVLEIESVQGRVGGAMTGTKSLTVRGELREGDSIVGSFLARRQKTPLVSGTCKALIKSMSKMAADIAEWLEHPRMRARLGSA